MEDSESRKQEEQRFHDALRSPDSAGLQAANDKFYSIVRSSSAYVGAWLADHCKGATALDYGSGSGWLSVRMAQAGAQVVGIDISEISVKNSRGLAAQAGVSEKVSFITMDAESLAFADNVFDVVHISGVLHHLDVRRALPELARILKPGGHVIATEALGHNPLIQWYRRRTPHLRTEWEAEHIIKREQLLLASQFFGRVDYRFFHLATLAAVPLRNLPIFSNVLTALERIDGFLLNIPGLKWQAWYIVLELSNPLKTPADDQNWPMRS